MQLVIPSARLAEKLISFGITAQKSKTMQALRGLDRFAAFWRGALDGDGSYGLIAHQGSKQGRIRLVGSKPFLKQFRDFARRLVPTEAGVYFQHGVWTFDVAGQYALTVIRALFDGATVSLPRKRRSAENILAYYGCPRALGST